MENLSLIAQKIGTEYGGLKSYVISSEKIALTNTGLLSTGQNEFPFTLDLKQAYPE